MAFTRSAVEEVARVGMERGGGARGLRGVLEEVLADGMFEIPGSVSVTFLSLHSCGGLLFLKNGS